MKKLDEKQKTIALIVGIVLVFAVVIFRVLGAAGGGPPGKPEVEILAGGGGGGSAAAVDNKKPIVVPPIVVAPNRNPFQATPTAPPVTKITTTASTDKQTELRGKFGMAPQTPMLPAGGFLRPDPLVMQVMGVVTGRNPVVVIRVNAKDYVVQRGVSFGKGLMIKQVTAFKVVVSQGKDMHVLEVGGSPSDNSAASAGFAPSGLVR